MIKHIIAKPIGCNGIIDIVILIGIPVIRQLLWAKHKDGLVAVFIVFNNSKRSKCFTKTDAVRKDTAIVFFKFVDDCESCISLEVIEHPPNLAFLETCRFVGQNIFRHIFQKLIEDIIKSDEVNKVRRILIISSSDTVNYLVSDDLKHLTVIPNFIKIREKCAGQGRIFYDRGADHISFFTAKFNRCEIFDWCITDTIHYNLSLNEFVADIRLKSNFPPDPLCTLPCDCFLSQFISELDFEFCSV